MKRKIRLTESELIGMIKNLIREFREKYPELLNPLLEKIGQVGYEGLSDIERKMIDNISQDTLDTNEIMMMVNKKIAAGEELSDVEQVFFDEYAAVPEESFEDIDMGDYKIDFEYNSTEENPEDDEIVHKGKIYVHHWLHQLKHLAECITECAFFQCTFNRPKKQHSISARPV